MAIPQIPANVYLPSTVSYVCDSIVVYSQCCDNPRVLLIEPVPLFVALFVSTLITIPVRTYVRRTCLNCHLWSGYRVSVLVLVSSISHVARLFGTI